MCKINRRRLLSTATGSLVAVSGCLSSSGNEQQSTPVVRKIILQNAGQHPYTVHLRMTIGDTVTLSESYEIEKDGEKLVTRNELGIDDDEGPVSITAEVKENDTERKLSLSEDGCFNVLIELTDDAPALYSGRAPEQTPCEVEQS